MEKKEPKDEMGLALTLATKTALVSSLFYAGAYFLGAEYPFFQNGYVLLVAKVAIVYWALSVSFDSKSYRSFETNGTFTLLSTLFFYGVMMCLLYLVQIGYVFWAVVFSDGFDGIAYFLLGVREFTVSAIFWTFLLAHVPYGAYYFFLVDKTKGASR